MSQFERNTVSTLKRPVSVDRPAGDRAQSDDTVSNSNDVARTHASERNEFRDGFMHGRAQSIRDGEQLSAYFASRDRAAATRGLVLGLLLASVVGGAMAALAYFELRLDSLTPILESPLQQSAPPQQEAPAPEAPAVDDEAPVQLRFGRGSAPQSNPFEESVRPEDSVPSEDASVPETSSRSSFSNVPLGLPPMGGPYSADEDRRIADTPDIAPSSGEVAPSDAS
ncbi:MAG: hypothetical protein AAFX40_08470 [Cyanobacteria bacterium J06639_1]